MESFRRQWNLDHITVTKLLVCLGAEGCRKWWNRFKLENSIVLAVYFQKQTDSANTEEKLLNQREVLLGGISHIYLCLSNKWKPYHGAINSWPGNLRAALEKYFRFHWNCKQLPTVKLWDLCPNFLWNYTYNFENIFTGWSYKT